MDTTGKHISPLEVSRDIALDRCEFLVNVQLWPIYAKLNPERWLANFTDDELPYAVQMLHSFIYFSELLVDQLLASAFAGLMRSVIGPEQDFANAQRLWEEWRDQVIITWVTGERPSQADSGHVFVRKARQVLGIDESRLLSPTDALKRVIDGTPPPLVFVDDFVGSGRQCIETWNRPFLGDSVTFRQVASDGYSHFFYSPLVCTDYGYRRLKQHCKGLTVSAAHVFPQNYSLLARDSVLWPEAMRESAFEVIRCMSERAGIPEERWQGFHELALGLAFYDSVPDATLPVFYWQENGWNPLMRRT